MKLTTVALSASAVLCAIAFPAFSGEAANLADKVLYSFMSGTDGQDPSADLLDVNGTLYGTTNSGGAYGYGAIVTLDRHTGAETVLYSFTNSGTDGDDPYPGLIDAKGTLYGTTVTGGTSGDGTVFKLDPATGTETTLYSFAGGASDGNYPLAGLIDVKGVLYGTTTSGGAFGEENGGFGIVFAVDPKTGKEKVLHSFGAYFGDGISSFAPLINVSGTLYGTTVTGGSTTPFNGTVFAIDPDTGKETVVYSFAGGADGKAPYAGLIEMNGKLYGTTVYGGGYGSSEGSGTVFALDLSTGSETVLHAFGNGTDGQRPFGRLVAVKGMLYGMTSAGGPSGDGTVFSVDPNTGAETVAYAFRKGTDGQQPLAGLTATGKKLYGMTLTGGSYDKGTIFALKP